MSTKKTTARNKTPKKTPNKKPEATETADEKENAEDTQEKNIEYKSDLTAFAASILQAQILGISQFEMMNAIRNDIRGSLMAIADVVDAVRNGNDDSQSTATLLREQLKRMERPIQTPELLGPIGSANIDHLAQSALNWADRMLSGDQMSEEIVFAEQIFQPDEIMSETQIGIRLEEHKWPRLSSRPTLITLISKVEKWFSEWIKDVPSSGEISEQSKQTIHNQKILKEAKQIIDKIDAQYPEHMARNRRESQALAVLTRNLRGYPVVKIPRDQLKDMDYDLIEFMFGGWEPANLVRRRNQDDLNQGDRPSRLYCPWGLFRYIRLFGENQLATEINEKLRTERRHLPQFARPDVLHSDLYEMHLLERQIGRHPEE